VVSGLLVHVYMGAVFPEEKPAFFSMITGHVDELYAYSHHFKWWREEKVAQYERRAQRDTVIAAATAEKP
jgi:formate dehydrogenase subunit gamma